MSIMASGTRIMGTNISGLDTSLTILPSMNDGHTTLRCGEEYKNVAEFYGDILGLSVARKWDGGIMFDTGDGIIEVFEDGESPLPQGNIRHFAFAAEDVDACDSAVRKAGYEVFVEPKDIEIQSDPRFPARIAFCHGPLGEEIEFFCEK